MRDGGVHLALGPLDDDAAFAVLEELPDRVLAARLVWEAGGNPLFLREMARAASAPGREIPPTIVAAIQQEAAGLPDRARELLAGAAVAGEPFELGLAALAAGLAEAEASPALDLLVGADLVRPSDDGRTFRFRHPVVARAVYDATPPARRLGAHERVAAELARRDASPVLRAHHVARFAAAGDEDAVVLLELAATEAVDTAPALAARWWGRAAELLGVQEPARRGRLLAARGRALAAAGRPEEALAVFDEARRLPGTAGAAATAARVERTLGRTVAARARLLEALDDAEGEDRAEIELELGFAAFMLGDLGAAVDHARRATGSLPAG